MERERKNRHLRRRVDGLNNLIDRERKRAWERVQELERSNRILRLQVAHLGKILAQAHKPEDARAKRFRALVFSPSCFFDHAYPPQLLKEMTSCIPLRIPLRAASVIRFCSRYLSVVQTLGLERILASPRGGRWTIRAAARLATSAFAHTAGFFINHVCTHRKAAEKVILSSCGGSNY